MAATQTTKFVNHAFSGTDGITITGITAGTFLLQSIKYSRKPVGEYEIKNSDGAIVTRVQPEYQHDATIELIPSSATDEAGAITAQSAFMAKAQKIMAITACASLPDMVRNNWFVESVEPSQSNTTACSLTITLRANDGITADPA